MSETIRKAIRGIAGSAPIQTYVCTVKSVDKAKCICDCTPVNGDADFFEVRLRSAIDDNTKGVIIFPKVDSHVLVGIIHNQDAAAFVVQYSEVDEVLIENDGGMKVQVKKDVVELNGNSNNGLVKLNELKGNLDSLKKFVDTMHQSLPAAFAAVLAGSAANGSLGKQSYDGAMAGQQITFKDMENKNVKHG